MVSLKHLSKEEKIERKKQQKREAQKRYYQKNKDYYKNYNKEHNDYCTRNNISLYTSNLLFIFKPPFQYINNTFKLNFYWYCCTIH